MTVEVAPRGKQAARAVAVLRAWCSWVEAAAFCQALARHRTHSSAGGGGTGASPSSASPSLACKAHGSVCQCVFGGHSRLQVDARLAQRACPEPGPRNLLHHKPETMVDACVPELLCCRCCLGAGRARAMMSAWYIDSELAAYGQACQMQKDCEQHDSRVLPALRSALFSNHCY